MKSTPTSSQLSITFLFLLSSFSWASSADSIQNFAQCLLKVAPSLSKVIYTPENPSYSPVLEFSARNLRFNSSTTPKPQIIVTPKHESQVQTVLYCAKKYGVHIRTRSGGHDFEGLSYISQIPFVLLDLIILRSIEIHLKTSTAWVQTGATFSELYHAINKKSPTLAFPGGIWGTVGVTGFLCGGGHGVLERKYGFGADNVIDARLIDINGKILDRKSMGEDLFWAIRGGTCTSFGIILSWKLKLVPVPNIVTVFNISKTLEEDAITFLHQWQYIAPNLHKDVELRAQITTIQSSSSDRADKKTVRVRFVGLFLGRIDGLLPLMQEEFPELGVERKHCSEVNWITAAMISSTYNLYKNNMNPDDLLDRHFLKDVAFKGKSDFVNEPMPPEGLNGIFDRLWDIEQGAGTVLFTPFGGRISEISESKTPFPYRKQTQYMVLMYMLCAKDTTSAMNWSRSLYKYMTPYVSKNPRGAYVNYNDLDLGVNNLEGDTSVEEASKWAKSYFNNNFERLVQVKTKVDPSNFFKYEQSIPPLPSWSAM